MRTLINTCSIKMGKIIMEVNIKCCTRQVKVGRHVVSSLIAVTMKTAEGNTNKSNIAAEYETEDSHLKKRK